MEESHKCKIWGGFGGMVFVQSKRALWDMSLERD